MIKAFRKQLQQMAQDPKDPFTQYVRLLAGQRQAPHMESPLRRMILHMPSMITRIHEWAADTHQPWKVRRAHNFILAYLYNPEDFLPEKSDGLFGYIDDAYLITRVYQTTLEELRFERDPLSEIPIHAEELEQWIQLTRELLPDVTQQIDTMLDRLEAPSRRILNPESKRGLS